MTTIYLVHVEDADGHSLAAPTLDAAHYIRNQCEGSDGRITKETVADLPLRRLLCALYNREGFSAKSVEVAPAIVTRANPPYRSAQEMREAIADSTRITAHDLSLRVGKVRGDE